LKYYPVRYLLSAHYRPSVQHVLLEVLFEVVSSETADLIGWNLLVTEARLEAELIYGMYAINRNMNMAL